MIGLSLKKVFYSFIFMIKFPDLRNINRYKSILNTVFNRVQHQVLLGGGQLDFDDVFEGFNVYGPKEDSKSLTRYEEAIIVKAANEVFKFYPRELSEDLDFKIRIFPYVESTTRRLGMKGFLVGLVPAAILLTTYPIIAIALPLVFGMYLSRDSEVYNHSARKGGIAYREQGAYFNPQRWHAETIRAFFDLDVGGGPRRL